MEIGASRDFGAPMQKVRVLLLLAAVVVSSMARAQPKANQSHVRGPTGNMILPPAVPEFAGVADLLSGNQGITVGDAFTKDDQQNPSLLHFQLFADGASPITSMELGSDGRIYVGYTPPRSPVWYDPNATNETDDHKGDAINSALNGTHPFNEIKHANVAADSNGVPVNWVPVDRRQLHLRLGYEDDDYSGNGYDNPDNGNNDQCKGAVNAHVEITVHHDPKNPFPSLNQVAPNHCAVPASPDGADDFIRTFIFDSNTIKYVIDRPNVRQSLTEYSCIRFQIGDQVTINASGCVQTGGSGDTWKRYVDPEGRNSDQYYHGLAWIPGVTPGIMRISGLNGRTLTVPTQVTQALPPGHGPATRWFALDLPVIDPCSKDRSLIAQLQNDLDVLLNSGPTASKCVQVPDLCVARQQKIDQWHQKHDKEMDALQQKLASNACIPTRPKDWLSLFGAAPSEIRKAAAHDTPPLPNSGDYCGHGWVNHGGGKINATLPEWETILPRNDVRSANTVKTVENGQRKFFPEQDVGAAGNHFVTWDELVQLEQSNPDKAQFILKYRNAPDSSSGTIPWVTSTITGVMTNSFLSGGDYAGDHLDPGHFLGNTSPAFHENCGGFDATNALCDDWVMFVLPDPEFHFLRMSDPEHESDSDKGQGNFNWEHQGNLENEVEQWTLPVDFRPQPGDRVWMAGRWIVDCGHPDWHGELHPVESFVSSHTEPKPTALDNVETVSTLVITNDWHGGTLEFDVWPTSRPSSNAALMFQRDPASFSVGLGNDAIAETPLPVDNPNHVHVTITATDLALPTGGWNDVKPVAPVWRDLFTRYHAWWTVKRKPRNSCKRLPCR